MLHRVVWQKLTDVSKVHTPHHQGHKHLRNASHFQPDYTAHHPRRQQSLRYFDQLHLATYQQLKKRSATLNLTVGLNGTKSVFSEQAFQFQRNTTNISASSDRFKNCSDP
jgi:hypothetical protein